MNARDDGPISSEIRARTNKAMKDRKPIPIEYLKYIDAKRYYEDKAKKKKSVL